MIKAVVKTLALLAILFVMLYTGLNNGHAIDFRFPVAGATVKEPLHAPAALIFFGVFAVGVLAGTMMTYGDKGGGKKSSSKDR